MLPIRRTSTGVVKSTGDYVSALHLAAPSGEAATAVINDSADGSGTDKWKLAAVAGGSDRITFDPPIYFPNGIYATLTGSGAVVSVTVAAPPASTGFMPDDVPQAEADALIALYNATNGDSWINNTNWLVDTTVGNWYGVTVAGGHVTRLDLSSNGLNGAIGTSLDPLDSVLERLYLYSNNQITSIDPSALTALEFLYVHACSLSALDISGCTALKFLRCDNNSIPSLDVSNMAIGTQTINCANNSMNQTNVDAVIDAIWTRRADWSFPTPILDIGGTNATPTGIYQDGYPLPLTALEQVHDLINDDNGAGIQVWASIVWNGGSAP